jgi:hypothetical protein
VQEVSSDAVQVAFVGQGYTGDQPAQVPAEQGLQLEVVKLLRRWVVDAALAGWPATAAWLATLSAGRGPGDAITGGPASQLDRLLPGPHLVDQPAAAPVRLAPQTALGPRSQLNPQPLQLLDNGRADLFAAQH